MASFWLEASKKLGVRGGGAAVLSYYAKKLLDVYIEDDDEVALRQDMFALRDVRDAYLEYQVWSITTFVFEVPATTNCSRLSSLFFSLNDGYNKLLAEYVSAIQCRFQCGPRTLASIQAFMHAM